MVEVGEIYTFTKLKVSNYKKELDDFNRLGTTFGSRIIKASAADKKEFESAKVMIGDHVIRGVIIGVSELNIYESCKVCWSKVDDEKFCKKCNQKVENVKPDFNLIVYVQSEEQEDEVLDIFSFKSTLDLKIEEGMEISEENLNRLMIGNKCEAQYNVDKSRDDERSKLVNIQMIAQHK